MTSREEIEHFYAETYECLMGRGTIGLFWRYIHSRLDKNSNCTSNTILLEIGAGHGQHFKLTSLKLLIYY